MSGLGRSGCLAKGFAWSFVNGLKRPASIPRIIQAIAFGLDWQQAPLRRGCLRGKFVNRLGMLRTRRSLDIFGLESFLSTMQPERCFELGSCSIREELIGNVLKLPNVQNSRSQRHPKWLISISKLRLDVVPPCRS